MPPISLSLSSHCLLASARVFLPLSLPVSLVCVRGPVCTFFSFCFFFLFSFSFFVFYNANIMSAARPIDSRQLHALRSWKNRMAAVATAAIASWVETTTTPPTTTTTATSFYSIVNRNLVWLFSSPFVCLSVSLSLVLSWFLLSHSTSLPLFIYCPSYSLNRLSNQWRDLSFHRRFRHLHDEYWNLASSSTNLGKSTIGPTEKTSGKKWVWLTATSFSSLSASIEGDVCGKDESCTWRTINGCKHMKIKHERERGGKTKNR